MNYKFQIVSPKYGIFEVTAPERFRTQIDELSWHVNYAPNRAKGNQFEVAHTSRRSDGTYSSVRLHQFIMELAGFKPKTVDHIDRNPLNNSEDNLRDGTKGNAKNRGKLKSNVSGFIGVGWHRKMKKWRARIWSEGNLVHLGLFDTIEEAVGVRDAAAIKYHGVFASLNQKNDQGVLT